MPARSRAPITPAAVGFSTNAVKYVANKDYIEDWIMVRILIVEDDEDLRDKVQAWLQIEHGHEIDVAGDGIQALEVLLSREFDVVVLDWDLPGAPGIEVLKDFRAQGGTTPVLMLTGRDAMDAKEMGFEAGADDYLTKPFHLKELTMRIKSLARRASIAETTKQKVEAELREVRFKSCPICAEKYPPETQLCKHDGAALSEGIEDGRAHAVFSDRYTIESVLGIGGMSTVYRAKQKLLDRTVAIKLLDRELAKKPDSVKRFLQEARTISQFDHENLISVHDFGISPDGQPFIVMDYIEGRTLEQVINQEGPLEIGRSLYLFLAAATGIAFAHDAGIIHRDIKPGNLMITSDKSGTEYVKLLDFGLAKLKQSPEGYVEKLTQGDLIIGTVDYMSPEHCQGLELDARTDVYSFGCVMYETVSGIEPFGSDNLLQTIQNQINKQPKPFNQIHPGLKVPDSMQHVIFKALEKDRTKRYQSMDELKDDLRKLYRTLI